MRGVHRGEGGDEADKGEKGNSYHIQDEPCVRGGRRSQWRRVGDKKGEGRVIDR